MPVLSSDFEIDKLLPLARLIANNWLDVVGAASRKSPLAPMEIEPLLLKPVASILMIPELAVMLPWFTNGKELSTKLGVVVDAGGVDVEGDNWLRKNRVGYLNPTGCDAKAVPLAVI